ncbi:hypothetical protein QCE63_28740 [Caballeronia sp. LZ065]|nr:hypothetical protein [Caballeronia sp. LZ065]
MRHGPKARLESFLQASMRATSLFASTRFFNRTSAPQFADVAVPVMPAAARRLSGPLVHPAYAVKLTTSLKRDAVRFRCSLHRAGRTEPCIAPTFESAATSTPRRPVTSRVAAHRQ